MLAGSVLAYLKLHQAAPSQAASTSPPPPPQPSGFKVEAKNLPPLSTGHYDAWVINGDTKTNIAKFNVDQNGNLATVEGKAIEGNSFPYQGGLVEGNTVAISVEAADSKDDKPSPSVILHGPLKADGSAELVFDVVSLSAVSGKYMLATPTDDPAKNESSGLWFGVPGTKPVPLLTMPPAPLGWKYEGWVTNQSKLISLGRFADARAKDDFNGYSATKKPAPNFPGQDFLVNAPADLGFAFPINLADGSSKAAISLEPDVGGADPTGPTAYLPLFMADIPSGLKDHVATDLTKAANIPSATFTYSQ